MKKPGREDLTAVCVGSITDDIRLYDVPKLKVIFVLLDHITSKF